MTGNNQVTIKGALDGLLVGGGENDIDCSDTPAPARIRQMGAQRMQLHLGLSLVELSPAPSPAVLIGQPEP